ncbi:MAG TPA: hypothetical protein VFV01_41745 [Spirillospora sp.]|nr:hypothetical protein [Spirillospora sp.]
MNTDSGEAAVSGGQHWKVHVYLSEVEGGGLEAWAVLCPGDGTALVGTGRGGGNAPGGAEALGADLAAGLALCDLGRRVAGVPDSAPEFARPEPRQEGACPGTVEGVAHKPAGTQ